jgi:hypothetical protein
MITLAIALADKWQNGRLTGIAYILAIIGDTIWMGNLAQSVGGFK